MVLFRTTLSHKLVYLETNPASFNSLILLVCEGVCVWAGSLVLLEVRGQLVGLCLILATIRLRHLVLWRLWHLSEVVVGAAHYPWIGKDRGGRWIETWKVKLILDQYWARRCLVEGHLRVGDPLQVVWVGACRQARGKAAWAHGPTHWVSTARIEGILQTGQGAVLWTPERTGKTEYEWIVWKWWIMTFLFTTQCFPHIDFPWGGHPGIKTAAQVYLIILAFSNVSFFYFIHPRNTIQALMLDISGRNYLKTAGQLQLAPIFKSRLKTFVFATAIHWSKFKP